MCEYLHLIDTLTGHRNNILPLFADRNAFLSLINDIGTKVFDLEFDLIAGTESMGYVVGAALAAHLKKGFLCIRKARNWHINVDRQNFSDRFNPEGELTLPKGIITEGCKVLLVEEWMVTGIQAKAAIQLIENQGGVVSGITGIGRIENEKNSQLMEKYICRFIWTGNNCKEIGK